MELFRRGMTAFATFVFLATGANADWLHNTEDDPFRGGEQHIAAAFDLSGELAGFRCSSADDLVLMFVTPEKPQAGSMELLSKVPVQLLVIVDNEPKRELAARIETTPNGERYRIVSEVPEVADVVKSALGAKKRFSVASQLLGQLGYTKTFNVRGSTNAIRALVSGCKIEFAK
jgi:hypothetical protein